MTGLGPLFAPRGIGVVGASADPSKLGAAMARSLAPFPGPVLLVNDRRPDPAAGVYRSVAEAIGATGSPVDLAVLCVPAAATAGALAEAAGAGARAALVCAGGFAEAGGVGRAHQADVAAVVAATGVRLLGPNTSGFLAPGRSLVASFVPGAGQIPAGRVSLVAGSGGILHAIAFLLAPAGLGLHLGVGIGNGLDVTAADVLDHLAAEAAARDGAGPLGPVALHVEGVTDGRRLVDAVERLTEHVPVVALVVGRNDVGDFARSHTGALTPVWRTARAALRAAGAVLVDDERELVDALVALDTGRLAPAGQPGVGLVTGQAGPAVLFTDRLKTAGVGVPPLGSPTTARLAELLPALTHQGNPVDTGRPSETFADVLTAVGADPAIDLLAVYALLEPGAFDLTATVGTAAAGLGPGGPPIVVATGGPPGDVAATRRALAAAGVAAYDGVAGAVAGVRALVDDARARAARPLAGPPVRLVVPEPFALPV
ncbi:MAG TPA: CoA-binding protein, partial [Acidimicrobiia bacterium]|nr:CoA-binding protein [Acidimicrobiia bacterium]